MKEVAAMSWCCHQNQTTPRRDEQGEYCRCLRIALENAVSVASVLLLTEATLTEVPETKTSGAPSREFPE